MTPNLFQYQGLAEAIGPPAGPEAWMLAPQVPVRRKVPAAVATFTVAPVYVPPDASQFIFPCQVPVRREPFQTATCFWYPSGNITPPTPGTGSPVLDFGSALQQGVLLPVTPDQEAVMFGAALQKALQFGKPH